MSCSRYQHDLSRCLDGRLPPGRRAAVLAHVDACPKCTQEWESMQTAQSLVFRLDPPRVAKDFRDQVWNRVHSGEGSSEILLQEPITAWTKVRYGMIGAAAAAAFLFGAHLLTTDRTEPLERTDELAAADGRDPNTLGVSEKGIAGLDGQPTLPQPNFPQPSEARPSPMRSEPRFVNPSRQIVTDDLTAASHLANQAVDKVSEAANRLKIRTPSILRGTVDDRQLWQEVSRDVQTIEGGLHVIETLQKKDLVELEPSSQACLTAARLSLKLYNSDSRQQTVNLVRTLDSCPLEGLTNVRVTYSIRRLRQPQGQLFGILAADPNLQKVLTQLGILAHGGAWMVQQPQFAPGLQHQRLFLNFQQIAPPPQAPLQQTPRPQTPPPKKELRKRSDKR